MSKTGEVKNKKFQGLSVFKQVYSLIWQSNNKQMNLQIPDIGFVCNTNNTKQLKSYRKYNKYLCGMKSGSIDVRFLECVKPLLSTKELRNFQCL